MSENPKASPALGLLLSSDAILGASLSCKNRKPFLDGLFAIPLDPQESTELHVKPLYKENEEITFHKLANKSLTVTGLGSKDVIIRPLTIQLTKERDIDAVLEFQAEPLLPYSTEEGILDRILLEKDKEHTKLTIIAAKSEHIQRHLEAWHAANIEPEVVGCIPSALTSYCALVYPAHTHHIHLHIGTKETTCILIGKQQLLAAQSVRLGSVQWTEALKKDNPDSEGTLDAIPFLELSANEYPSLLQQMNMFRLEVAKVIFALKKNLTRGEVKEISLSGEAASNPSLAPFLTANLHLAYIPPASPPGFNKPIEILQAYAVPIGLALSALPHTKDQINFRQKGYAFPNPWKRIKQPLAAYLGLCFGLSAALYLLGSAYIASKEDALKQHYVDLLAQMKKPYAEFEKEIRSKQPQGNPEIIPPVISLNQSDIQQRLDILEKEIRATPDMFSLYPNVPRVSDVLAWLSTYQRHLAGKEAADEFDAIEIDSFSYKMVKRPEQSKKKEQYQAKVEIEFTSPTPRVAREFHDLILAPNDMIDPKSEVKWNADRGKYRASFFLKDKTIYPGSG